MLWYDGKITSDSDTLLSVHDRGVTLGDGLFETLPCFNGRAYLQEAHIARIKKSAASLAFPFDQVKIEHAINDLAAVDKSPGIVRVTLTRGLGQRGLALPDSQHPHIFATRSPWTKALAFGTARLNTSTIRRNTTSPTSSHKTLSYIDNVMAYHEARQNNADDALMLDEQGHISCTSMANLFALSGGELITPANDGAILPGVIRALVLIIAPSLGLSVMEKKMNPRDLFAADFVFSTNSVRFMTAITAIDGTDLKTRPNSHYNGLKDSLSAHLFGETGFRN